MFLVIKFNWILELVSFWNFVPI